jgi:enoyl-CoA hydratase/carnithine racemase
MTPTARPFEPVLFEVFGSHIALVTLNRPDKRNAVNGDVTAAMVRIIAATEADPSVRAVVLASSHPRVFCAGADLAAVASNQGAGIDTKDGGFAGFTAVRRLKPWIAAVDGVAVAGGCEIVLACDMVVAGEGSTFGVPEVKRGLLAGSGGTYRLPKVLPRNVALEMLATGEPIDAARAHHFGLVNELVPAGQARDAAMKLAARIAENAPLAVQHSLFVARNSLSASDEEGRAASMEAYTVLMASEDIREGPRAFLEKRAPVWKGR